MDDTLTPDGLVDDAKALPVQIDALAIDGTRPEVGDTVTIKVKGPITKVVDTTAWVKPETVNDAPIPTETHDASEDELMQSAMAHDMAQQSY